MPACGQLNTGVDPEILAIGTEMTAYHIEKGARKWHEWVIPFTVKGILRGHSCDVAEGGNNESAMSRALFCLGAARSVWVVCVGAFASFT